MIKTTCGIRAARSCSRRVKVRGVRMKTFVFPKAMSSKTLCFLAMSSVAFLADPEWTGHVDSHVTLYLKWVNHGSCKTNTDSCV